MKKNIKIYLVDDHSIFSDGLKMILENENDFEVIGIAQDASTAMEEITKNLPDLAIIDISIKGSISGIELTKALMERFPDITIMVLSMHDESIYAERALRAGARGYLMKHELTTTVIDAVRHIMSGKIFLNPDLSEKLLENIYFNNDNSKMNLIDSLTDRELEVLQLLGRGYKTNEIAKEINVSVKTVDTYKIRLKEKLHLEDASQLLKYSIEWVHSHNKS